VSAFECSAVLVNPVEKEAHWRRSLPLRSRVSTSLRRHQVCPGPDSNRHGVAPEGFSYPLQLSLLPPRARRKRIWGLDFTFTVPRAANARVRRGPSSLYTFPMRAAGRGTGSAGGLSSVLQPPRRAAGLPTLTPFTPGVSASGCSISLKSLASTDFATRAAGAERTILQKTSALTPAVDTFAHGAK
jgi:hypothetical protein